MSQPSLDTQAWLGRVTGSVTMNKPAVPTEAERAGCWSACINFRGLLGPAVSTVVTIAEPRRLLGKHAVSPATVVSTQEAEHFFFFLFISFYSAAPGTAKTYFKQWWHVRRALLLLQECVRDREKAGSAGAGSPSVHPVWGGRCVTLWGQLPAWQLRTLSPWLCLSLASSSSLCFLLSVRLLRPLIYQFAIDSNIPISRHTQKQLNCSLKP